MSETTSSLDGERIESDSLFNALANQRRRYILSILCDHHHQPIALPDLAEEVATREKDTKITEIPPEQVKTVYMTLYHAHIPMLEDAGIVKYNQDRDTVSMTVDNERIESLLDV